MKKEERQQLLKVKLQEMKKYEEALYSKGLRYVAGVDEVGRGPLAGPVVAAAVVLPEDFNILGVDDSKKLSEKKREEKFIQIKENSIAYGIGVVDNRRIDNLNILVATKVAMKDALRELEKKLRNQFGEEWRKNSRSVKDGKTCCIHHILIDALTLRDVPIPQTAIVKGDTKSVSIAAASILAKVTRDRMMVEYHEIYPHYSYDTNKGYGTKAHYDGIQKHGICPIHRLTFLKKL